MRALVRLVVAIVFVSVLGLGALAMIDNPERVALHFLQWQTPPLSIYWWLFSALLLGFFLGWALTAISSLKRRSSSRQARD